MRLDEILEALPDVGFSVWRLDEAVLELCKERCWHCVLEDTESLPLMHYAGDGATALAAIAAALLKAGVDVTDG